MKKKHRDIIVDGQQFGYVIKDGGKERYIAIYKNKKPIFATTWRVQTITPKDIEELIRKNCLTGHSIPT